MSYWPHAVQTFLISMLLQKFINKVTKDALIKELETKKYNTHGKIWSVSCDYTSYQRRKTE